MSCTFVGVLTRNSLKSKSETQNQPLETLKSILISLATSPPLWRLFYCVALLSQYGFDTLFPCGKNYHDGKTYPQSNVRQQNTKPWPSF